MTVLSNRIDSLQSLRAIAIFAVFLSHCSFIANVNGNAAMSHAGATGVSIFIALSGFLTYLTSRNRDLPAKPGALILWFGRKIGKFYPLHIITLLIALPLALPAVMRSGSYVELAEKILLNLTLLQSWVPDRSIYFSLNAVAWFLSTYAFCLICTPLLMRLAKCCEHNTLIPYCAIAIICAIQVFLVLVAGRAAYAHWLIYVFPPARLFDFFAGMMLGVICETRGNRFEGSKLVTVGGIVSFLYMIGFNVYMAIHPISSEALSVVVWTVPTLFVLAFFTQQNPCKLFSLKPLVFFGNISMEFFLVHQLAIKYVVKYGGIGSNPVVELTVCFVIALLAAWILSLVNAAVQKLTKGRGEKQ